MVFTMNLAERHGYWLWVERINVVREPRFVAPFHVAAVVILPDHSHWVRTLVVPVIRIFLTRSSLIKGHFSAAIEKANAFLQNRAKGVNNVYGVSTVLRAALPHHT